MYVAYHKFPAGQAWLFANQSHSPSLCLEVALLVAVRCHSSGDLLPGASQGHSHHGRQLLGLGCPRLHRRRAGYLDTSRRMLEHQSSRTQSRFPRSTALRAPSLRSTCASPHRQHDHESTYQPSRGNNVSAPLERGDENRPLGRAPSPVSGGGAYIWGEQPQSGLAQPTQHRPDGMVSASGHFSSTSVSLRPTSPGPLCHPRECPASQVLHPLQDPRGGGNGRYSLCLAPRTPLCVPSHTTHSQAHSPNPTGKGGGPPPGPSLAQESLVRGPYVPLHISTVADPADRVVALPGLSAASRSRVDATSRLALERLTLAHRQVPEDLIDIMITSRRPSTERIYSSTWRAFCKWCQYVGYFPLDLSIVNIIQFLRQGLGKGLSPNTLRRQLAALSTVLSCASITSLAAHPLVQRFLKGVSMACPPVVHRFPTWDLTKVLDALTREPFEPLNSVSLRHLTFKVTFLVAITSARRISELAALSVRRDLCSFHPDRVVLRLDPSFIPKVNSPFHRSQEVILPCFFPSPASDLEKQWHTLDVRRALEIYIDRTSAFRKTEALLVSFRPSSLGQKVSSPTVGRWIRALIALCYTLLGLPQPERVTAHSTRSAATTAAWSAQASIAEVCRAATWASLTPFIRHYKVDSFAKGEADFGQRVLFHATRGQGSDGQP